MDIILQPSNFLNNKYQVAYGTNQQAMFTIVDESFAGMNTLGTINCITCMVRQLDNSGNQISGSLATLVIGIGDGKVGAFGSDPTLNGQLLTQDNMGQCTIRLYEL